MGGQLGGDGGSPGAPVLNAMTCARFCLVSVLLIGCSAPEPGYEILSSWTTASSPSDTLREPMGVAVSPDGSRVYVADARAGRIFCYAA